MPRSLRALVAALCLVAFPAAAQSAEVRKFLNAATALYENLEYEKALKQIAKAKQKATASEDEVRVELLEGVVLADMGREEKAVEAFKAAFSLELDAKLPLEVSPKVQAVAEKARASVRKVLAPALEQQRLEAEQKAEAERKVAEARAREEEAQRARATTPPPPAGTGSTTVVEQSGGGLRGLAWVPAVVGVAAGAGSAYFLLSANGKQQSLLDGSAPPATAAAVRDSGKSDALAGTVLGVVAVAGLATAAGFFLADGAPAKPAVTLVPLPGGGAWVGVAGSFGGAR